MTDKSSISKFGSQNLLKPDIWGPQAPKIVKGQPETHKGGLEEPNRSHRGCLETPLDSLGTPWGLPGRL